MQVTTKKLALTIALGFAAVVVFAQAPGRVMWDGETVPITIQVTRDVPVVASEHRADGSYGQERGKLYSTEAFIIGRGETFRVLALGTEGGCRIEYQGKPFELASCPSILGFRDNQVDIFAIIEVANETD